MLGRIEETKISKSRKTLGVKIGGEWYSTKNWELGEPHMIGQEIIFQPDPWTPPDGGKAIVFINDYQEASKGTGPAAEAMDRAVARDNAERGRGSPTPPIEAYEMASQARDSEKERAASIVSQALCKASCQPGEPFRDTWDRYTYLYHAQLNRQGLD